MSVLRIRNSPTALKVLQDLDVVYTVDRKDKYLTVRDDPKAVDALRGLLLKEGVSFRHLRIE